MGRGGLLVVAGAVRAGGTGIIIIVRRFFVLGFLIIIVRWLLGKKQILNDKCFLSPIL